MRCPGQRPCGVSTKKPSGSIETAGFKATRPTGLEPATSGVTGRCSNQLSYDPRSTPHHAASIEMRNYSLLLVCCKSRDRRTEDGFPLELATCFGCDGSFREVEWGSMPRVKNPDLAIRHGSHDATCFPPAGSKPARRPASIQSRWFERGKLRTGRCDLGGRSRLAMRIDRCR